MLRVGVIGPTGLVGEQVVALLGERRFPVAELVPLATEGRGRSVSFGGERVRVQAASLARLSDLDLVFNCAGSGAAEDYLPRLADRGVVCIDKSTSYRMDPEVPLVVVAVNGNRLREHRGIVASPNCLTIQLVSALGPLHRRLGLGRVVVSTYQSASGAGRRGLQSLRCQVSGAEDPFRYPLGGNLFPEIGGFTANGHTTEEEKIRQETRKILEDQDLPVSVTAVRVGVEVGHCAAVWFETNARVCSRDIGRILAESGPLVVAEAPSDYSTPLQVAGGDEVHVGRIRADNGGFWMWVAADNLRRGAATNALEIAERLLVEDLI